MTHLLKFFYRTLHITERYSDSITTQIKKGTG